MPHLHYSPFQWATSVEASEHDVSAKKVVKKLKKLTAKDKLHVKLMSCEEAHSIPGSPNAFISPNSVDGMRMIRGVFGSC